MFSKVLALASKFRVAIATALALGWLLPHRFCVPPARGIDPSWMLSLNWNIAHGAVFGKDVVFTYGPLGNWVTRLSVYLSPVPIILFRLFLIGSFLWLLYQVFSSVKNWLFTTLVLVALVFAAKFLSIDASLWVLFFVVFYLVMYHRYGHWLLLIVALVLSLLNLYIKLNSGVVSLLCVVGFLVLQVLEQKMRWYWFVGIAMGMAAAIAGFNAWFNVSFLLYAKGSLEIIKGYNESMLNDLEFPAVLVGGLVAVAVSMGYGFWLLRQRYSLSHLFFSALFTGLVFVSFKQGFVRAFDHELWFFTLMPFCALLWFFVLQNYSLSKTSQAVVAVVALVCMACCLPYWKLGYWPHNPFGTFTRLQKPTEPTNASGALHSAKLRRIIGNQTVDIFTIEADTYFRGQLNYRSRPVCQTYSTYTAYLDSINAAFFTSPTAPAFVLYCNRTLDKRNVGWDESKTKIALLSHYVYADTVLLPPRVVKHNVDTFVVLKRRPQPLRVHYRTLFDGEMAVNQPLTVPKVDGLVVASIAPRYTFVGTLAKIFYQPGMPQLAVAQAGGQVFRYSQPVPVLESGIIINRDFDTQVDALRFFGQQPDGPSAPVSLTWLSGKHNFKPKARLKLVAVTFQP
jgi:hypothetical protein